MIITIVLDVIKGGEVLALLLTEIKYQEKDKNQEQLKRYNQLTIATLQAFILMAERIRRW